MRRRLVIEVLIIGMMMLAAQENTGADIFRIEPETPYPTDLDTLAALGAEKQDNNARPALKSTIENLDQYNTVFVGYPSWWGDMPMILSFLMSMIFLARRLFRFIYTAATAFPLVSALSLNWNRKL